MLWIKRAVSVVAVVLLVVGSGVPAMAVTPQEGWYISEALLLDDGVEYFVIDNKLSTDQWLVDLQGSHIQTANNLAGKSPTSSGVYSVVSPYLKYEGYSQTSWRIDQDWVLEVYVASVETNLEHQGNLVNGVADQIDLLLYDVTKVPTINYAPKATSSAYEWDLNYEESLLAADFAHSVNPTLSAADVGKTYYYPVTSFQLVPGWFDRPQESSGAVDYVAWSSLRLCDINNLRIAIKPSGYWTSTGTGYATSNARLGFRWLCPVDKAPAGMMIGDPWPKQQPLEVVMQDAYDAYKQTMMQNGQIKDPTDINTMFGNLGDMKDQGLAALDIGDTESDFFSAALSMFKPLFLTLLPVVGVGVVLIIFANKGMNG